MKIYCTHLHNISREQSIRYTLKPRSNPSDTCMLSDTTVNPYTLSLSLRFTCNIHKMMRLSYFISLTWKQFIIFTLNLFKNFWIFIPKNNVLYHISHSSPEDISVHTSCVCMYVCVLNQDKPVFIYIYIFLH